MPDENIQTAETPVQQTEQQAPQQAPKTIGGSKKPLIIIAGVVILALGIGAGLYFFKDTIFPVRGISGKVLSAQCRYNDPDLCRFLNNFKDIKNISATSVSTINGNKTESVINIEGDDKTQMVSKVNGKEESNYISIGKNTYMKDYSDNKWWKSTDKTDTTKDPSWKTEFDKSVDDTTDKTTYKKIAKESCGKLTCWKYQVIDPKQTEGTEYIWFDTSQYLVRKDRMESKEGTFETEFSYDKVNVSAPSPTKEMTNPEAAIQGTTAGGAAAAAAAGLTPEQLQELQNLQNQAQSVPTDVPTQ